MPSIKGTILESYTSKLSRIELDQLNERNQIKNSIERQYSLKTFFGMPDIFNKVKEHIDPMWLSHDIFLKGKDYEF
jgi:hypothetical protein